MSFLDDETATAGQISLGTRQLGLDPLLPRRRRRQAAQQQQAPGYDILPSTMQPIPGVVSTPTDIAQVGVGQQLQQQGTTAAQVPNVFEKYAETGAAPIGDFRRYLYPTSPAPEDEEQNDLIEATNEEFAGNFGIDPYDLETPMGQFYSDQEAAMEQGQAYEFSILSGAGTGRTSLPISQALKAGYEAAKYDLTGGKSGRPYNESLLNYAINLDVNKPVDLDTEAGAKDAAAKFGITVDEGSGAATGPAPALTTPAGAKDAAAMYGITVDEGSGAATGPAPVAPVATPDDLSLESGLGSISVGNGGGAATGPAPATSTPPSSQPFVGYDPGIDPSISVGDGGGDGGDAAAPSTDFDPTGGIDPNIFASGGIVTKSKTKNKTSFMSMKGK